MKKTPILASEDRYKIGRRAGAFGIVCNFTLFALKLLAGYLSASVAITADAFNNLTDAASSLTTYFGFRLAARPADAKHPYGHGRYEYLSGLLISFLILLVGVEFGRSAVLRILSPEETCASTLSVLILCLSIVAKGAMALYYRHAANKITSTALRAACADSRNDLLATLAVLLGFLAERLWGIAIDGPVALLVALFICYSGTMLLLDSLTPLLGKRADESLVRSLSKLILSYPKVLGMHDLLVHDYGSGVCHASAHVELSAEEDSLVCHDLIDEIECAARDTLGVHLVIHFDPVVEGDTEKNEMQEVVREILREIHPRLTMHDFRLVRSAKGKKLSFDLAVPYELMEQRDAFHDKLDTALSARGHDYQTVIRFDATL